MFTSSEQLNDGQPEICDGYRTATNLSRLDKGFTSRKGVNRYCSGIPKSRSSEVQRV